MSEGYDSLSNTPVEDFIYTVFRLQHQLMIKYDRLQHQNGCYEMSWCRSEAPLKDRTQLMNNPHFQMMLRRYAWQITEEVAELASASCEVDLLEEAADVFHYLVELAIQCRLYPYECFSYLPLANEQILYQAFRQGQATKLLRPPQKVSYFQLIHQLGMTMNLLKNRPWRTDNRPTDFNRFRSNVVGILQEFFTLMSVLEIGYSDFCKAFLKKVGINEQRIAEMIK